MTKMLIVQIVSTFKSGLNCSSTQISTIQCSYVQLNTAELNIGRYIGKEKLLGEQTCSDLTKELKVTQKEDLANKNIFGV